MRFGSFGSTEMAPETSRCSRTTTPDGSGGDAALTSAICALIYLDLATRVLEYYYSSKSVGLERVRFLTPQFPAGCSSTSQCRLWSPPAASPHSLPSATWESLKACGYTLWIGTRTCTRGSQSPLLPSSDTRWSSRSSPLRSPCSRSTATPSWCPRQSSRPR